MDARALLDIHVSGMFQADSKISMKKHGAETGRDASEGDGISRTDVPATGTRLACQMDAGFAPLGNGSRGSR